jgi:hypothetical protein
MLQDEMLSCGYFSSTRGNEFFVGLLFVFKRILMSQIPCRQIYGPHEFYGHML